MAGRSLQKRRTFRGMWVLLVLLIGFSSGMTATFAGADFVESAGLTVLGLIIGGVILWLAFPTPSDDGVEDERLEW